MGPALAQREGLAGRLRVPPDRLEKGGEERAVTNGISFRVVLHSPDQGAAFHAHLLDDSVERAPGFRNHARSQPVERLVVRAIDQRESEFDSFRMSQGLNVSILQVLVARHIEMEASPQGDIEKLCPAADRENGKLALQCGLESGELPCVPLGVRRADLLRSAHFLAEEGSRDVGATREEKPLPAFARHPLRSGVAEQETLWFEDARKNRFVLRSDPGGDRPHRLRVSG